MQVTASREPVDHSEAARYPAAGARGNDAGAGGQRVPRIQVTKNAPSGNVARSGFANPRLSGAAAGEGGHSAVHTTRLHSQVGGPMQQLPWAAYLLAAPMWFGEVLVPAPDGPGTPPAARADEPLYKG